MPEKNITTNELETAINAMSDLLCATDHYGFRTFLSESFWEHRADSAAEDGQTSDDVRREVWLRAYKALAAVNEEGQSR